MYAAHLATDAAAVAADDAENIDSAVAAASAAAAAAVADSNVTIQKMKKTKKTKRATAIAADTHWDSSRSRAGRDYDEYGDGDARVHCCYWHAVAAADADGEWRASGPWPPPPRSSRTRR